MASPEVDNYLRIATRDWIAAEVLIHPKVAQENWGFQLQQAIEKTLKAWLLLKNEQPPLTHNLTVLFQLLADLGENVDRYLPLEIFSAYAVQFRYDDAGDLPPLDQSHWQQEVHQLMAHVKYQGG